MHTGRCFAKCHAEIRGVRGAEGLEAKPRIKKFTRAPRPLPRPLYNPGLLRSVHFSPRPLLQVYFQRKHTHEAPRTWGKHLRQQSYLRRLDQAVATLLQTAHIAAHRHLKAVMGLPPLPPSARAVDKSLAEGDWNKEHKRWVQATVWAAQTAAWIAGVGGSSPAGLQKCAACAADIDRPQLCSKCKKVRHAQLLTSQCCWAKVLTAYLSAGLLSIENASKQHGRCTSMAASL